MTDRANVTASATTMMTATGRSLATLASAARGTILTASAADTIAAIDAKTSGNVMTGDGTDAVSAAIATPLAVAPTANRAALLPLTLVSLASASGWTYDTVGSGSTAIVNTGAQTIDLATGSSGVVSRAGRAVPWSSLQVSVRARLSATNASTSAHEVAIFLSSSVTGGDVVGAIVYGDGTVKAAADSGSGGAVSVASILGGQGWARLDVIGGTVAVYAGVGSAGAEPTSWTPIGSIVRAVGSRVPWEVVRMQLNASVAKTASWDSIRYRVADLP